MSYDDEDLEQAHTLKKGKKKKSGLLEILNKKDLDSFELDIVMNNYA